MISRVLFGRSLAYIGHALVVLPPPRSVRTERVWECVSPLSQQYTTAAVRVLRPVKGREVLSPFSRTDSLTATDRNTLVIIVLAHF